MAWLKRIPIVIAGLLAGTVAALVTTLAMLASRYWLGIMPPIESMPDRVAQMLDIGTFFSLFGIYGGYNGLKQFGIISGLRGLLTAGLLVGAVYALVVESAPSRRSKRWILGTSAPAFIFVAGAVVAVWIGFVIFLWPVMAANYRGLPWTWARIVTIVALLVWFVIFGLTVIGTYRFITTRIVAVRARRSTNDNSSDDGGVETVPDGIQPVSRPVSRRAILAAAGGAALTYPVYRLLENMYNDATFFYDGSVYSGDDIQPIAPVDRFYVVTKNVIDPEVDRDLWRLEIGGHVDNPISFNYDDLQNFEQIDQETTLMCISNRIGAGLFANAHWRGVRLADVLQAAGPREGALEVFIHGADAYRDSFAFDKAMEETTLVVYEINGQPLPRINGYPVRIIVPGLFGEKNVKWVTRVDVVTEDAQGFYELQGWGPDFEPPIRSDIFAPRAIEAGGRFVFRDELTAGQPVEVRGRAYGGDQGIRSVEYSTDDGQTWAPATIYYPGTDLTWSLWSFVWEPPAPGEYIVTSRAVDGTGTPQPIEPQGIVPDGAQGYHRVAAIVR